MWRVNKKQLRSKHEKSLLETNLTNPTNECFSIEVTYMK